MHIQRPCNTYDAWLLYNSASYVAFVRKENILSFPLVTRDCYYLPLFSQLWLLFTNELSTSSIVVLCSDRKFIYVSHKKTTLWSRSQFFQKSNQNRSKHTKAESWPCTLHSEIKKLHHFRYFFLFSDFVLAFHLYPLFSFSVSHLFFALVISINLSLRLSVKN